MQRQKTAIIINYNKMKAEDIKIGKWYKIKSYGYSYGIRAKAVDVIGDIVVMKFYWGVPFRTRQGVEVDRILEECKKPSFFSNY